MAQKRGKGKARVCLVLGVGNILMKDEGFGVRTVEHILENYTVPDGVTVLDGGTGGLGLVSVITGYERLVIIDAVRAGSVPGTLHRIEGAGLEGAPSILSSAHRLGVRDMLAVAGLDGPVPEVVVIGVEPEDVSAGLGLTGLIEAKVPEAAVMVARELDAFGVELKEKKSA